MKKTLQDLLDLIDEASVEELRGGVKQSFIDLYATSEPHPDEDEDEDEDEEDRPLRLLTTDEDFPSGADFIEYFIDNLPESVRNNLP